MKKEYIFSTLNKVLQGKVYYGINVYDNETVLELPYIIFQEVSSHPFVITDNKPVYYKSTYQITLVTKKKDVSLETSLQNTLLEADITYSLTSEYFNEDHSVSRAYEITMEDI